MLRQGKVIVVVIHCNLALVTLHFFGGHFGHVGLLLRLTCMGLSYQVFLLNTRHTQLLQNVY